MLLISTSSSFSKSTLASCDDARVLLESSTMRKSRNRIYRAKKLRLQKHRNFFAELSLEEQKKIINAVQQLIDRIADMNDESA